MAKKTADYKARVRKAMNLKTQTTEAIVKKDIKSEGNRDSVGSRQIVFFADTAEQKQQIKDAAKSINMSMAKFVIATVMARVEPMTKVLMR